MYIKCDTFNVRRSVCQRSWLYLEPIFSSDDINRQLPVEGKRYCRMHAESAIIIQTDLKSYENEKCEQCYFSANMFAIHKCQTLHLFIEQIVFVPYEVPFLRTRWQLM